MIPAMGVTGRARAWRIIEFELVPLPNGWRMRKKRVVERSTKWALPFYGANELAQQNRRVYVHNRRKQGRVQDSDIMPGTLKYLTDEARTILKLMGHLTKELDDEQGS